jgi:hypothetical protein
MMLQNIRVCDEPYTPACIYRASWKRRLYVYGTQGRFMGCPCVSCSYKFCLRLILVNAPAAHMGKVAGIGLTGIERHAVSLVQLACIPTHQTRDRVKSCTGSQQPHGRTNGRVETCVLRMKPLERFFARAVGNSLPWTWPTRRPDFSHAVHCWHPLYQLLLSPSQSGIKFDID